jgi:L-threonylcarbamoyladenylate synthase
VSRAVRRWRWGDESDLLLKTLRRGGVIAVPTGSSYALAADPSSDRGVAAVFRIKRRPADKPLPVVIPALEALGSLGVRVPDGGLWGLERAWPGALSILLPCPPDLPAACGSGRLAIRIPGHERLRILLVALGMGVTATSANRSGQAPALEPDEVLEILAGEDAVLVDDGNLDGGEPSTLVEVRDGRAEILRPGRVGRRELVRLAPALFSAGVVEISVEDSK